MEIAEAVRAENNFLREANCASRSGSIDHLNGSVIGNSFIGNEDQLLNSLEPDLTNEVVIECHTMGDAQASITQDKWWIYNSGTGDVPILFLAEEAGKGPSILTMQQNPDNVSTIQLIIQADSDTESGTDV